MKSFINKILKKFFHLQLIKHNDNSSQENQFVQHLNKDLLKINIELEQERHHLKKTYKQIIQELDLAHKQQMSIIPKKAPEIKGLKISYLYKPSMKVGGDYFDFFKLNDHHLGVVVADVSGHGLSASQVMAMAKMSFYHHFNFNDKLSDIVFKINKDLTDNIKTGHYLTACVCIIDTKKKSLRYSRVSHPYPILINKNKPKLTELDSKGMILGKFEKGIFEEKTISLNSPCRLFLYTDGLFEIYFERKAILGRGLIKDFLLKNINIPNENIIGKLMEFRKNHVEKYIKDYVDEDDIVAVCIDIE